MTARITLAEERSVFWARVRQGQPDECWLIGGSGKRRYGRGKANGRWEQSQRAAWIFTHGEIPHGQMVLHTCDTPRCCNPAHLFLGTQLQNVRDCISKGRFRNGHAPPGEKHHNARLKERDVVRIRARRESGVPLAALSKQFKISVAQVSRIALKQRWASV